MSADVSDLSLVRRVQRGDKGAFDALVLKYQHKLVKLVMRYVRNPAEAATAPSIPGCTALPSTPPRMPSYRVTAARLNMTSTATAMSLTTCKGA
jgi:hypothetical protein